MIVPQMSERSLISPKLAGYIDLYTQQGRVEGWAIDESDPDSPVELILRIDGLKVGTFAAAAYRRDLHDLGYGRGSCAFFYQIPRRYCDGNTHEVAILFKSTGDFVEGSPKAIYIAPYVLNEIRGFVDNINEREITGWALDPARASEPLVVELVVDGIVMAQTLAEEMRDDLKVAGIGDGRCAFRFATPQNLLDDIEHPIIIRIVGTDLSLPALSTVFRGKHNRSYRTFTEYLRWALYHQEIHPPFNENDRLIVAEMFWLTEFYDSRYTDADPSALVSIIMPTYNRASLIREAINSVIQQTYTNWELIIVDDASSDSTSQVVASYYDPRIKYVSLSENSGPSAARAAGMKLADGIYFAYLDSDNTWDPRFLKIMIGRLREMSDRKSIYCAQLVHQESGSRSERKHIRFSPFNRALLENSNFIDVNAFVHDRSLYAQYGGFKEDIRMLEDWDLITKYTEVHFPIALPCLLSHYFIGKSKDQVTFLGDYISTITKIQDGQLTSPIGGLSQKLVPESRSPLGRPILTSLSTPLRSFKTSKFVSIVIPSFEAGEFLDGCIESIVEFSPDGYFEIIIVDNASVGSVLGVISKYRDFSNVKVIQNVLNHGFSFAANQGIRASRPGSDVILLNNDAVVSRGWLEAFWEVCDYVADVSMIVPRQVLLPGTDTASTHAPRCNPLLEVDVNISAHHRNVIDPFLDEERGFMQLSFAAFFCVYITRDCLDCVGLLDEKNGRHYRSDAIFSDLAQYLGSGKMVYTPHAKLYHFLQRATGHLRDTNSFMYDLMFVQNKWDNGNLFRGLI